MQTKRARGAALARHSWTLALGACTLFGLVAACGEGSSSAAEATPPNPQARADIVLLSHGLRMYAVRHGGYPSSLDELMADAELLAEMEIDSLPRDPWGRPYGYELRGELQPRVFSLGADGTPGGTGEDLDLDVSTLPVANPLFSPRSKLGIDISQLWSAVHAFARENGQYPTSLQELLGKDAGGEPFFFRALPLDPWGRPYGYEAPSKTSGEPRVFSLGADGKPGGAGDDADVDIAALKSG